MAADLPFASFDPHAIAESAGGIGLCIQLLRLSGMLGETADASSASQLLALVRSPETIASMQPRQDLFLPQDPGDLYVEAIRPGRTLIAAENQALWFADIADEIIDSAPTADPASGSDIGVSVYNPEIGVTYGDLLLTDFLVRMVVQEVITSIRPRLWERRTLSSATLPTNAVITDSSTKLEGIEAYLPPNVTVGHDWILQLGTHRQTIALLRYQDATATMDERFEHARGSLHGTWT